MTAGRQKILIIDDTPANIQVLNELLRETYLVYFATSGSDGLRIARRERPDLILLDVMMPDQDGYAVCAELRNDPLLAATPVIFVTALCDAAAEARGLTDGAIDYVTKPISPPVVLARIRNHLEMKRQHALLTETTAILAARNREMEQELVLARHVLSSLLPKRLDLPALATSITFRPSNQIGGDFYDGWHSGKTHLLVGDISGHSTPAALMMAAARGALNAQGQLSNTPAEIVTRTNCQLDPILQESQMFLTLVYAIFDPDREQLRIVSAGHHPIYLVTNGNVIAIESSGPPLGWGHEDRWEEVCFPFHDNDLLFLYTDGLTDAKNPAGRTFASELYPLLSSAAADGPDPAGAIFRRAEAFCSGRFEDDVTIVTARRRSP